MYREYKNIPKIFRKKEQIRKEDNDKLCITIKDKQYSYNRPPSCQVLRKPRAQLAPISNVYNFELESEDEEQECSDSKSSNSRGVIQDKCIQRGSHLIDTTLFPEFDNRSISKKANWDNISVVSHDWEPPSREPRSNKRKTERKINNRIHTIYSSLSPKKSAPSSYYDENLSCAASESPVSPSRRSRSEIPLAMKSRAVSPTFSIPSEYQNDIHQKAPNEQDPPNLKVSSYKDKKSRENRVHSRNKAFERHDSVPNLSGRHDRSNKVKINDPTYTLPRDQKVCIAKGISDTNKDRGDRLDKKDAMVHSWHLAYDKKDSTNCVVKSLSRASSFEASNPLYRRESVNDTNHATKVGSNIRQYSKNEQKKIMKHFLNKTSEGGYKEENIKFERKFSQRNFSPSSQYLSDIMFSSKRSCPDPNHPLQTKQQIKNMNYSKASSIEVDDSSVQQSTKNLGKSDSTLDEDIECIKRELEKASKGRLHEKYEFQTDNTSLRLENQNPFQRESHSSLREEKGSSSQEERRPCTNSKCPYIDVYVPSYYAPGTLCSKSKVPACFKKCSSSEFKDKIKAIDEDLDDMKNDENIINQRRSKEEILAGIMNFSGSEKDLNNIISELLVHQSSLTEIDSKKIEASLNMNDQHERNRFLRASSETRLPAPFQRSDSIKLDAKRGGDSNTLQSYTKKHQQISEKNSLTDWKKMKESQFECVCPEDSLDRLPYGSKESIRYMPPNERFSLENGSKNEAQNASKELDSKESFQTYDFVKKGSYKEFEGASKQVPIVNKNISTEASIEKAKEQLLDRTNRLSSLKSDRSRYDSKTHQEKLSKLSIGAEWKNWERMPASAKEQENKSSLRISQRTKSSNADISKNYQKKSIDSLRNPEALNQEPELEPEKRDGKSWARSPHRRSDFTSASLRSPSRRSRHGLDTFYDPSIITRAIQEAEANPKEKKDDKATSPETRPFRKIESGQTISVRSPNRRSRQLGETWRSQTRWSGFENDVSKPRVSINPRTLRYSTRKSETFKEAGPIENIRSRSMSITRLSDRDKSLERGKSVDLVRVSEREKLVDNAADRGKSNDRDKSFDRGKTFDRERSVDASNQYSRPADIPICTFYKNNNRASHIRFSKMQLSQPKRRYADDNYLLNRSKNALNSAGIHSSNCFQTRKFSTSVENSQMRYRNTYGKQILDANKATTDMKNRKSSSNQMNVAENGRWSTLHGRNGITQLLKFKHCLKLLQPNNERSKVNSGIHQNRSTSIDQYNVNDSEDRNEYVSKNSRYLGYNRWKIR